MKRLAYILLTIMVVAMTATACRVSYTFSGASISPLAKTVSIAFIPNNAPMVAPILSPTLRSALQDRFVSQTRLALIPDGGDLHFEGEITGYTTAPAAISGNEFALRNRLTITVRMRFTNAIEPKLNYDKTFSEFLEYDASLLLQSVEPSLIPQIVDMLADDIFNAAVSNW